MMNTKTSLNKTQSTIDLIIDSLEDVIAVFIESKNEYYRILNLLIENDVKWYSGKSFELKDAIDWNISLPSFEIYMVFDKETKRILLTGRVCEDTGRIPFQIEVINSKNIK